MPGALPSDNFQLEDMVKTWFLHLWGWSSGYGGEWWPSIFDVPRNIGLLIIQLGCFHHPN